MEEKEILKKGSRIRSKQRFFFNILRSKNSASTPPPPLKKVIFQAVFLGEERVTVD